MTPNNRLQRTVRDEVPRHEGQRAAGEPVRWAVKWVNALTDAV